MDLNQANESSLAHNDAMKKLGSALKVGLASAKFLKVLGPQHHEKNEASHKEEFGQEEVEEEVSPSKIGTFFFMGMDIPIEMTDSLKQLDERSLRNPFMKNTEEMKISEKSQSPDFLTKLTATVEKINAYKEYFYNKGQPTGKLRDISNDSLIKQTASSAQYPYNRLAKINNQKHHSSKSFLDKKLFLIPEDIEEQESLPEKNVSIPIET